MGSNVFESSHWGQLQSIFTDLFLNEEKPVYLLPQAKLRSNPTRVFCHQVKQMPLVSLIIFS